VKPEDVQAEQLLVDTDVFSYVAAGKGRHADFEPFLSYRVLVLSFATVAELWYLAEKAGWGDRRRRDLALKIAGHAIVYPDMRVAQKWAELSAAFRGQLGGGETHDLWTAACAMVHGIPMITNNLRHFQPVAHAFPELQLVHPDL
jgi:predicted nucleic acid-binding protein